MPSIEQLQALLEKEPGDSFLLYGIGQECLKLERFEDAASWFDQTMRADPDHCYAYFFKARALSEMGDNEAAVATVRAGVENARRIGDGKALSELSGLLDELE
ncbi:MAG: tetratricopeptide repeat protein [Phycisphaerales bacterium]